MKTPICTCRCCQEWRANLERFCREELPKLVDSGYIYDKENDVVRLDENSVIQAITKSLLEGRDEG